MVPAAYRVNSVPADVSSSVRDATTTLAPCAAKPRHIARPMPRLPPVTSATLLRNVIAFPCAGAKAPADKDTGDGARTAWSLLLLRRHSQGDAGDVEVPRPQVVARGDEERLPAPAAEADVGGRGLAVQDAAELLARAIENPQAARTAAI